MIEMQQRRQQIMETEIVLLLRSLDVYTVIRNTLEKCADTTCNEQYNFYGKIEMNQARAVLRYRKQINVRGEQRGFLTLKANQVRNSKDGAFTRTEIESELTTTEISLLDKKGIQCALELSSASNIIQWLQQNNLREPVIISSGYLMNTRMSAPLRELSSVNEFQNEFLELDSTKYEFGTMYYIEVECARPDEVIDALRAFLASLGIFQGNDYKFSTRSKYEQLLRGAIDPFSER